MAKRKMVGAGYFDATGSTVTMIGSDGDDQIVGNHLNNRINAKAGDDIVASARGNDRVIAGAGDDTVVGGSGEDRLFGGTDADKLYGNQHADRLYGEDGNDILFGGSGNDILSGGNDQDILTGDAGNDKLYGDAGSDHLYGGDGNDQLYGGADSDVLVGGNGSDVLFGGTENDMFLWTDAASANHDQVMDFVQGEDVFNFNSLGMTFIDTAAFSGVAGELRTDFLTGVGSRIQGDLDGDSVADFEVLVADAGPLVIGDFIL